MVTLWFSLGAGVDLAPIIAVLLCTERTGCTRGCEFRFHGGSICRLVLGGLGFPPEPTPPHLYMPNNEKE